MENAAIMLRVISLFIRKMKRVSIWPIFRLMTSLRQTIMYNQESKYLQIMYSHLHTFKQTIQLHLKAIRFPHLLLLQFILNLPSQLSKCQANHTKRQKKATLPVNL